MALSTTRMSSKGQVVIPEEIRKELNLTSGDRFIVMAEKDVLVFKMIIEPSIKDYDKLVAKVRREAKKAGLTKKDLDDAIKEVRKKK